MEICGRDGRTLAARVEQKNGITKDDKNRVMPPGQRKPHTSRMRETCTYGSVRGASSNGRPYRNPEASTTRRNRSAKSLRLVTLALRDRQQSQCRLKCELR